MQDPEEEEEYDPAGQMMQSSAESWREAVVVSDRKVPTEHPLHVVVPVVSLRASGETCVLVCARACERGQG